MSTRFLFLILCELLLPRPLAASTEVRPLPTA